MRATSVRESRPIEALIRPFQEFASGQASSGILLLVITILALVWANSPWAESYFALWHAPVAVSIGGFSFSKDLLHWINDGLMTVFFFVVGLEIKREMLVGELSSLKQAALPIVAAVGGMVAPALLYAMVAGSQTDGAARGWGVPMATDIAFSLGVLALLGSRAPISLKVFLTAFAIADDLGAVMVIALFYTEQILPSALLASALFLGLAILANVLGVRSPIVYGILGFFLWVAVLKSGIHATVAGVAMALTIPASARMDRLRFLERGRGLLDRFEEAGPDQGDIATNSEQQAVLHTLEESCEQVKTPLQRLEHALHPWVSFLVMPIFALANAGVAVGETGVGSLGQPVSVGILLGLLIGKPVGVTLFAWLAVRSGIAALPPDLTMRHIHAAGWLGGIGFTMALFIAGLAFGTSPLLGTAKMAILTASVVAGVIGFVLVKHATGVRGSEGARERGSD